MARSPSRVTRLLRDWRGGNANALDELTPLVYDELRVVAGGMLRNERAAHTLQPTGLVNEVFLRLLETDVGWQDRVHFFALAARMMRRILVDHAKSKSRAKRGGGAAKVALEDVGTLAAQAPERLVELDRALTELESFDARKARIIDLVYFGGLTYEEVAEALDVSRPTVQRDLKLARAWLRHELADDHRSDS